MKKILFYPGTFNPPHFGHVSAIQVATSNLDFDEVWIMPSGNRVDKVIPTSVEDRKNLSNIFIEYLRTVIKIPVKPIMAALENVDGKYTHEVIMELKNQSENEIFQLVGIDGFLGIKERVIGPNEKFVIIKRSGYEFPEELKSNKNLVILDEGVPGISSTKIREMIKNGDDGYEKLVPEKIASYIEERSLYR
ncbi:MAG TPA: nicotinate-nicotinamide nucleotide adenylyltransferase [Candidatus Paceibacterota bacterium]